MPTNVYRQYQESAITQSDPVKLVEMMYEGAIRFTNLAIRAIEDKELEGAHNCILRAYAIVAELMATLDFEHGGEIAVQLEQCYDYILFLLKEANIAKEKPKLIQVVGLLEPLLKAWHDAFPNGTAPSVTGAESNGKSPVSIAGKSADDPAVADADAPGKPDRKSLDVLG